MRWLFKALSIPMMLKVRSTKEDRQFHLGTKKITYALESTTVSSKDYFARLLNIF